MAAATEVLQQGIRDVVSALGGLDSDAEKLIAAMAPAKLGALQISNDTQAKLWLDYAAAQFWQPIRVMLEDRVVRSAGFPDPAPNFTRMTDWCSANCKGAWVIERNTVTLRDPKDIGVTFWFEEGWDAHEFTIRWLPIKCT